MKRLIYLLPAFALYLASCSDEVTVTDGGNDGQTPAETSNLTTVKLATFNGDASRITYTNGTRADADVNELQPGELKLTTIIENPNKEFYEYTKADGGRYMSATSVFKNSDGKYYVTYHVQGNNYNTDLKTSVAGAIQVFEVNNDGTVNLGKGFRAVEPSKEDYDFNHIYFDKKDNRIVVVGHKWSVPSSWNSEDPYTGDNTRAIIGSFNPDNSELEYKTITTSIEVRDDSNKLIDHEDAGDANCVVRIYDQYYLATRKGIAVLEAKESNLFDPVLNEDGSRYFVTTPGSCKFVNDDPNDYTRMQFLYLSEEKENTKDQTSKAKIVEFKVATDGSDNKFIGFINENSHLTFFNSKTLDLTKYEDQFTLPNNVSPIDGKNTICAFDNAKKLYVSLGKGGLYYKHPLHYGNETVEGTLTFDNRPVNCVYAEAPYQESFHGGYIYVANGARLTIIDRASLEEVASYTLSAKDGINENEASANYIHVEMGNSYPISCYNIEGTVKERIITVAYGQAGVRIFKFMPKPSSAYPAP